MARYTGPRARVSRDLQHAQFVWMERLGKEFVGAGLTFAFSPFATDLVPQFVTLIRWQDIGYEPFMDPDFVLKEARRLLDRTNPSSPTATSGTALMSTTVMSIEIRPMIGALHPRTITAPPPRARARGTPSPYPAGTTPTVVSAGVT